MMYDTTNDETNRGVVEMKATFEFDLRDCDCATLRRKLQAAVDRVMSEEPVGFVSVDFQSSAA